MSINLKLENYSRTKILFVLLAIVMFGFALRLFYLQVIRHDYYVELANNEQIKRLIIPAERGEIYALDNGKVIPLAMNQTVYTLFADPQIIEDEEAIIKVVNNVAGGNTVDADLKELLSLTNTRYQVLARGLTRLQADKIKEEGLKGIGFQERTVRVYPEGQLASQVLGFVNYDGIGQYGVEGALNESLTGVDGLLQSVTDVSQVPLSIGNNYINQPAVDGTDIVLSIDRNIQSKVEETLSEHLLKLGAERGSVLVMNPNNGQVLAMFNMPTYNPSNLDLVDDMSVFNNATISSPYEPGSNIKSMTMAVGIDKGVAKPTDTYVNTGSIQVDDVTIHNAVSGHTGTITFQYALNWSLNTGFVTIAQRLGDGQNITRQARDTMYDYFYNRFKLGQLTGIELSGEASGIVISPDEMEGNAVRYSNMSFGQGMDVTMIQVASAFSSLVNGGNYYKPTIIAGSIDESGQYIENEPSQSTRTVAQSTANSVRSMLQVARQSVSPGDNSGYYVGGKTGTSQVVENGTYSDDETIASYVGYGGSINQSEYVIMVQVSGDDRVFEGARDAMPVFTEISNWMLDYLAIKPED